jgi:hypothetical protein
MEHMVGLGDIIYIYRKQGAGSWIHGSFPQLLCAHLAQTLIALNLGVLARLQFA